VSNPCSKEKASGEREKKLETSVIQGVSGKVSQDDTKIEGGGGKGKQNIKKSAEPRIKRGHGGKGQEQKTSFNGI